MVLIISGVKGMALNLQNDVQHCGVCRQQHSRL